MRCGWSLRLTAASIDATRAAPGGAWKTLGLLPALPLNLWIGETPRPRCLAWRRVVR